MGAALAATGLLLRGRPNPLVDHDHPRDSLRRIFRRRREAQGCAMFLEMDAAVESTQVARARWSDLALV